MMHGIHNKSFSEERHQLVDLLRRKGIRDEAVLDAIVRTPRELFMPEELQDKAYIDRAFPIGEGQTISQPYTVVYQTELLEVQPGDKILEIGTGSAYQASILCQMGAEVYTIERQRKLYDQLRDFDYIKSFQNLHRFYGDGYEGLPRFAPFDKILITAAVPYMPPQLSAQLKANGIAVLPMKMDGNQQMIRITKYPDGTYSKESFDYFSFVPMVRGKN